jgi:hypothetical protein
VATIRPALGGRWGWGGGGQVHGSPTIKCREVRRAGLEAAVGVEEGGGLGQQGRGGAGLSTVRRSSRVCAFSKVVSLVA